MKVVIVGGGFCGSFIAKSLGQVAEIQTILIDKHPYFEYKPNLHQILSKKKLTAQLRIPYRSFLDSTTIISEPITEINDKTVNTISERIHYDYLIISTGVDYPIALDNINNVHVLQHANRVSNIAQCLHDASQVLIVGGGLVGCEVAGELAFSTDHLDITLVHSKNRLLERNSTKASSYAFSVLKKAGCHILLNEKVIQKKNDTYITDSNKQISADICIWCTGIKANPEFMKGFPDHCFTKNGFFQVNTFLQLRDHQNIFVGGDITSIAEEKTAQKAERHAHIISSNIMRLRQKKPLIPYQLTPSPIVISLGNYHGIIQLQKALTGPIPANTLKNVIQKWIFHQLKKRGI